MKPHEREEWNNRPTTVTTKTLCEGGCNTLKDDVKPRSEKVFNYTTYEWVPLRSRNCCDGCWVTLVAETRYPPKKDPNVAG